MSHRPPGVVGRPRAAQRRNTGGALAGWIISIIGAVVLIAILRALGFFRPTARV